MTSTNLMENRRSRAGEIFLDLLEFVPKSGDFRETLPCFWELSRTHTRASILACAHKIQNDIRYYMRCEKKNTKSL